jgi:hypothetical protein
VILIAREVYFRDHAVIASNRLGYKRVAEVRSMYMHTSSQKINNPLPGETSRWVNFVHISLSTFFNRLSHSGFFFVASDGEVGFNAPATT